jgi:hypothetical protein
MSEGTPYEPIMMPIDEGMMGDMGQLGDATPAS